jgi:hypothetical protein
MSEISADMGENQELIQGWIDNKAFFKCEKEAVYWKLHFGKSLKS